MVSSRSPRSKGLAKTAAASRLAVLAWTSCAADSTITGDLRGVGGGPLGGAKGRPVHDRHHQIQHNHIWPPAADRLERCPPVRRHPDGIALVAERSRQGGTDQSVIVDDQNAAVSIDGHLRDCF